MPLPSRRPTCSILAAILVLAGACSPSEGADADGEAQVAIAGLYQFLIDNRVSGAPSADQLVSIRPFLTAELTALLESARALGDDHAAAYPDEKPPFVEGDLFSSLFEGPTRFEILAGPTRNGDSRHAVRFFYDRESSAFAWEDTVIVRREGDRTVVADVLFGGSWDFANRGSLVESLSESVVPPATTDWTAHWDGIGAVRLGMTISAAERALGSTARVERIEPGETCGYAYVEELPAGVSLMLSADTIVRVNVGQRGVPSAEGARVGDVAADLIARYGADRIRDEPHKYTGPVGRYLIVEDPGRRNRRLIFETDGRVVTEFRVGRIPEVDLVEGCA